MQWTDGRTDGQKWYVSIALCMLTRYKERHTTRDDDRASYCTVTLTTAVAAAAVDDDVTLLMTTAMRRRRRWLYLFPQRISFVSAYSSDTLRTLS